MIAPAESSTFCLFLDHMEATPLKLKAGAVIPNEPLHDALHQRERRALVDRLLRRVDIINVVEGEVLFDFRVRLQREDRQETHDRNELDG